MQCIRRTDVRRRGSLALLAAVTCGSAGGPCRPGGNAAGTGHDAHRGSRRHGAAPRAEHPGRRHRGDAARRERAAGPQHHDRDRHREGRAEPQDERVLERAGGVQHPRRRAERLRRPAGAAGRRLPGRQLLELDQPRELSGVRPRARRNAARPAGHAVRPQRDRRRDPVHLEQADRRVRGLQQPDRRQLQPGDRRRRALRPAQRQRPGPHSPSSSTRTTAGWSPSFPGVPDRGGNDHYALRGRSPGSRAMPPTCRRSSVT